MLSGRGDSFLAGGRLDDTVVTGFQAHPQQSANLQFIIDDENRWLQDSCFAHKTLASITGGGLLIGIRMRKRTPPPG